MTPDSLPTDLTDRNRATGTPPEAVVRVSGLTKVFKDFWGRPKARARSLSQMRVFTWYNEGYRAGSMPGTLLSLVANLF